MTNQFRLFISALAIMFAVLFLSCGNATKKHRELRASKADSILFDIGTGKDYDYLRAVTDSFEMVGDLSPLDANRWRGTSYYRQGHYNMAEVCYRKAM